MYVSDPAPLETFTIRPYPLRRSSGRNASVTRPRTKQIRFERLADDAEVSCASPLPGVVQDRGVVDQYVQPVMIGLDGHG
jgi:hypothetical protein